MIHWWLYVIPFIGALIGWLANAVAVRLLLHRSSNKTLGLPESLKKQIISFTNELTDNQKLFEKVEQEVSGQENFIRMMPTVEAHIDIFLREKLKKEMPVIGTFIGEKTIGQLKGVFMKELEELFPEMMKNYLAALKTRIDPQHLIISHIENLFSMQWASTFRRHFSKQIKLVELYGCLTGFISGVIQVAFILLLN